MSYNTRNYIKKAGFIVSVYNLYKHEDVPDTDIVRKKFPNHGIFISYRQWMNIKGLVIPKEAIINGRIITIYEKLIEDYKPINDEQQLAFKF